ncbi:MAG: lysophospholipid acyltransferase family protein [Candidatus Cloacimonadota bacterium]|nr:lysophospholipid acyltransferase family protein [Candidatus Cloacimonadota bacterium]
MKKIGLFLEKYLGALFILILGKTLRFELYGKVPQRRVIYACWHRNLLPLAYLHRYQGIGIMVSRSRDGELIAGPIKLLGYHTPRGSSSKGSLSAMKEMVRLSNKYNLAITPDGPKGPSQKIKKGLLYLAYHSKLPIVPVAVDIKKERVFNSWDKFRLPKFFSKINVVYGKPIAIKNKQEIKDKYQLVQKSLENIENINKAR